MKINDLCLSIYDNSDGYYLYDYPLTRGSWEISLSEEEILG